MLKEFSEQFRPVMLIKASIPVKSEIDRLGQKIKVAAIASVHSISEFPLVFIAGFATK